MNVSVPKEIVPGEHRVALVPDVAGKLGREGVSVRLEAGAGTPAGFPDDLYAAAGVEVQTDTSALWGSADAILKIHRPIQNADLGKNEVELMRRGAILIAVFQPLVNHDVVRSLARHNVTSFSLDLLPRITRAQPMDVLSAMSTVAGYKAVLMGAGALGKFFPMLVTAAGTLVPARVLVLGAGVAGLQAIATARRLGALVQAFDVRPAAREQVESLGARFLAPEEVSDEGEGAGGYAKQLSEEQHRRELELIAKSIKDVDVVVTTALIPGKTGTHAHNARHGGIDAAGICGSRPCGGGGGQLRAEPRRRDRRGLRCPDPGSGQHSRHPAASRESNVLPEHLHVLEALVEGRRGGPRLRR